MLVLLSEVVVVIVLVSMLLLCYVMVMIMTITTAVINIISIINITFIKLPMLLLLLSILIKRMPLVTFIRLVHAPWDVITSPFFSLCSSRGYIFVVLIGLILEYGMDDYCLSFIAVFTMEKSILFGCPLNFNITNSFIYKLVCTWKVKIVYTVDRRFRRRRNYYS